MDTELLRATDLSCSYADTAILNRLSMQLDEGDIACLLGPSGCGKTTALRAIAGFIDLDAGVIELSGETISSAGWSLPPEQRGIGMVFQDYALFPHLSIEENIAFGLGHLSSAQRRETVSQMLGLIDLKGIGKRYPHQLSGGQQQRVALARALAPRPRLLLMDEPFSNLDADMRRQLSAEMRRILKQQGIAAVLVTHDQQEAFTLADKLGVLADGRICQWGTPQTLYNAPVSAEIASFISSGSLVAGQLTDDGRVLTELGLLEFAEPLSCTGEKSVQLFLRPTDIELATEGAVDAQIAQIEFQGSHSLYHMRLASGQLVLLLDPGMRGYQVGDHAAIRVRAHRPLVFPG